MIFIARTNTPNTLNLTIILSRKFYCWKILTKKKEVVSGRVIEIWSFTFGREKITWWLKWAWNELEMKLLKKENVFSVNLCLHRASQNRFKAHHSTLVTTFFTSMTPSRSWELEKLEHWSFNETHNPSTMCAKIHIVKKFSRNEIKWNINWKWLLGKMLLTLRNKRVA
jgi:hypothetical protein